MNIFAAKRVKGSESAFPGGFFSAEDEAAIDKYPWGGEYRPDARAAVKWDDDGLWVRMRAEEERISYRETRFGGAVCRDSCLEFFVNPCPSKQEKYINLEINPAGVMHIGVGADRWDRHVLTAMPDDMALSVSGPSEGRWAVIYRVSFRLMEELCGYSPERKLRANFYNCSEDRDPHFGTWNPVNAEKPDFHRPECFGILELTE